MKRYYKLFNFKAVIVAFGALLLLASCSSYQYAGYEDDGIYSSERTEAYTANDYEESYEDALYYKRLFAEKSEQFARVPEEGAIFTDIESYTSTGNFEDIEFMQQELDYQAGRAPWGNDPDEISINIYQDPFFYPYYGYPYYGYPYYAGFYDPFWGPRYYGYGHPFRYGYGYGHYSSWGWSFGFGWNNYYRYGYHPYYGGHHYYPYYNRDRFAYNSGRRDSYRDYSYNRSDVSARSSRIQKYSNPRNVRAVRSNADARTYQTRTTRVRSSSTPVRRSESYNRSRNESNIRGMDNNRTRSNNSTRVRSTRSSNNNSSSVRSSSSNTRSSSSGNKTSSSRSSRGRGN
ncbi:hypothetical protein [Salinimicrobium flavum]|uniref:Vitellogenin II n=1 Tax=Salinimicrobium flavum TaxID=1737065 RepID=A0ABW5IXZ8_9FLAO